MSVNEREMVSIHSSENSNLEVGKVSTRAEEEHDWTYIGSGEWTDPHFIFSDTNTPVELEVDIYQCRSHPGVLTIKDGRGFFASSPVIHCENPRKVYVETYEVKNGNTYVPFMTLCWENNWIEYDEYGTLVDNVISIPSEAFIVYVEDEFYRLMEGSTCKLTLPSSYTPNVVETPSSGIYFGITAFNYLPEILPMDLLTLQNKNDYKDFVNSRTPDNYTYLYYSAEQAIKTLKEGSYPDDLMRVALITFTDGNDDGSLDEAPDDWDDVMYQSYVESLISNVRVNGLNIDAYSIGLKGEDIGDYNYAMFKSNLQALATAPKDSHATEVDNMEEVERTFNQILDNLERSWLNKRVKCNINMRATGDKIRFTLDKTREEMNDNPDNSELWIEGVFSRDDNSLNDIVYHGCTSSSGTKVISQKVLIDGRTKYQFVFENLKNLAGDVLETGEIHFWHATNNNPIWQPHTEFAQENGAETETDRESAAIMLVMDCSSSLGDDFKELKRVVNALIDRIMPDSVSLVDNLTDEDDSYTEYYTIQGFKVSKPSSGLYIEKKGSRTKKIIVR